MNYWWNSLSDDLDNLCETWEEQEKQGITSNEICHGEITTKNYYKQFKKQQKKELVEVMKSKLPHCGKCEMQENANGQFNIFGAIDSLNNKEKNDDDGYECNI